MNSGAFSASLTGAPRVRALAGAKRLGYEFQVISFSTWTNGTTLTAGIWLKNSGIAPFYYNWPVELAAVTVTGEILREWSTPWNISGILPGTSPVALEMPLSAPPPNGFTLLVRVINPLPSGKPLRFANSTQDSILPGWLTLGIVR
jgi:hypothetical protein